MLVVELKNPKQLNVSLSGYDMIHTHICIYIHKYVHTCLIIVDDQLIVCSTLS